MYCGGDIPKKFRKPKIDIFAHQSYFFNQDLLIVCEKFHFAKKTKILIYRGKNLIKTFTFPEILLVREHDENHIILMDKYLLYDDTKNKYIQLRPDIKETSDPSCIKIENIKYSISNRYENCLILNTRHSDYHIYDVKTNKILFSIPRMAGFLINGNLFCVFDDFGDGCVLNMDNFTLNKVKSKFILESLTPITDKYYAIVDEFGERDLRNLKIFRKEDHELIECIDSIHLDNPYREYSYSEDCYERKNFICMNDFIWFSHFDFEKRKSFYYIIYMDTGKMTEMQDLYLPSLAERKKELYHFYASLHNELENDSLLKIIFGLLSNYYLEDYNMLRIIEEKSQDFS